MNKRTVAAAFREAAAKFESGEWKRVRADYGREREYSAIGGVCAVIDPDCLSIAPIKKAFDQDAYPGGISLLVSLNDNPSTSNETVIKRMRDIAYALEHGGKDRAGNKVDYV